MISDGGVSDGTSDRGGGGGGLSTRRILRSVRTALRSTLRDLAALKQEASLSPAVAPRDAGAWGGSGDGGIVEAVRRRVRAQAATLAGLLDDNHPSAAAAAAPASRRMPPGGGGRDGGGGRALRFRVALGDAVGAAVDGVGASLPARVACRLGTSRAKAYWAAQRARPTVVKLLDKWGFLLGVLSLTMSEYVLCRFPDLFWAW